MENEGNIYCKIICIQNTPRKIYIDIFNLQTICYLKNMVGPGDVDDELEPEVKDECNTKYGEVVKVLIHEAFGTTPEDAVKIFVEFKRMESAIKGKRQMHYVIPFFVNLFIFD